MRQTSCIEFPAHVHLETLALCNAACGFCAYPGLARKGAKMDDGLIAKIIGDLGDIPKSHRFQLSPFKVNEPFLDARLFDLIEIIQARLPNASLTLTTNASPISEKTLARLSALPVIDCLWISFNEHRAPEYEAAMKLPYRRTIARLDMIHRAKADGRLKTRIVLSRVGDGSSVDADFTDWVRLNYPLFGVFLSPRGDWLGQSAAGVAGINTPDVGCIRWFDLSIMATGEVAHCCMDGKGEFKIGDARRSHVLEIYNQPEYRQLREHLTSRLDTDPCRRCSFL